MEIELVALNKAGEKDEWLRNIQENSDATLYTQ